MVKTNFTKRYILITTLLSFAPLYISAQGQTNCVDFLIGNGEVRMDWTGVNLGSPTYSNAQTQFTLTRSSSLGVANFTGFFQAKNSHRWNLSSGDINGNSFSFKTVKSAREGTAGLKGGGTCEKNSATGRFAYYGEGDGYSFTFKMYKN